MEQNQLNFKDDKETIKFLFDLVSQMYIQLALVSEQVSSLTKVLWGNQTISDEELIAINDDMETLVEQFSEISEEDSEKESE